MSIHKRREHPQVRGQHQLLSEARSLVKKMERLPATRIKPFARQAWRESKPLSADPVRIKKEQGRFIFLIIRTFTGEQCFSIETDNPAVVRQLCADHNQLLLARLVG